MQKEAANELATMQSENEMKLNGLKEELEDAQAACEQLKGEIERREGLLASKSNTEDELEGYKGEA